MSLINKCDILKFKFLRTISNTDACHGYQLVQLSTTNPNETTLSIIKPKFAHSN